MQFRQEARAAFSILSVLSALTRMTGPKVIIFNLCSTQLSMKFILLINAKMPTIVLTFISMINTTSERLKARNLFICRYFSFMIGWYPGSGVVLDCIDS